MIDRQIWKEININEDLKKFHYEINGFGEVRKISKNGRITILKPKIFNKCAKVKLVYNSHSKYISIVKLFDIFWR